jgi:hypothetical protein
MRFHIIDFLKFVLIFSTGFVGLRTWTYLSSGLYVVDYKLSFPFFLQCPRTNGPTC